MNFVKHILKFAVKLPKIEEFDRFLFVGPHPDDIEIGAGATICKLARENKKITFLICTDGRFGDGASDGITGDELAALRKKEAIRSASVLGVSDVRFLDLTDGGNYDYDILVSEMAKVVCDVNPQIVFAPDCMSLSEFHPDHINVGKAAKEVAFFSCFESLMMHKYGLHSSNVEAFAFYMTNHPNRYVKVRGLLDRQFEAIFECHKSQYPEKSQDAEALKLYLKLRYHQFHGKEGFRVYSRTHMHCLPEAE